jgi:hypothetical protein
MPIDIYICFHRDEMNKNVELVKKLENDYTIQSAYAIEGENDSFEGAKLFLCILSSNFLSDYNCMGRLKNACKVQKIIIILNSDNDVQFNFLNDECFNDCQNSKILMVNYTTNERNENQVKMIIDYCLKYSLILYLANL